MVKTKISIRSQCQILPIPIKFTAYIFHKHTPVITVLYMCVCVCVCVCVHACMYVCGVQAIVHACMHA